MNKYMILGILAVIGGFVGGYTVGYNTGVSHAEEEIVDWLNTHEKYRVIIERIWEDVDEDMKKKYGNP